MGKLVKFDRRRRPVAVPAQDTGNAQILIFTGVRYERGTPSAPTSRLNPPRPKRKRV